MPTPACLATAVIGAPGSATNTARADSRMRWSLRAASAWRPLIGPRPGLPVPPGRGLPPGRAFVSVMKISVAETGTNHSVLIVLEQKISFRWSGGSDETGESTGGSDVISSPVTRSANGGGGCGATGRKWRWVAFGAVITAAVMDLLDSTIAQVAAPTIRRELGGSYAVIEWVTAAYALAMAVGLLTGGRLGDIFGRRRVLLTGMAGFVLASAACAAAQSAGELIGARAAQGLLGAIMLPQVFGLIRDMFEAHEMGKAFGVYGPVMGLSAMLGPIAAGGLISVNVLGTGWRMIFLVNVPVGLAALALGARTLPAGAGSGTGAARGGWTCRARCWPARPCSCWSSRWRRVTRWAAGLAVRDAGRVGAVLAGFGWYQVRRQRAGRDPLVEPSVFRHRSYRAGIVFSVVFTGSLGGIVMIFNVFLQNGLGFTPWHSAVTTAPWAAGAFIGSAAGGIAMAKLGRRVLHAGLVVEAAGLLGIYLVLRGAAAASPPWTCWRRW